MNEKNADSRMIGYVKDTEEMAWRWKELGKEISVAENVIRNMEKSKRLLLSSVAMLCPVKAGDNVLAIGATGRKYKAVVAEVTPQSLPPLWYEKGCPVLPKWEIEMRDKAGRSFFAWAYPSPDGWVVNGMEVAK